MMWTYFSVWAVNQPPKTILEICLVLKAEAHEFHYKTTLLRPCGQVMIVERYDSELFITPDGVARTYGEFL